MLHCCIWGWCCQLAAVDASCQLVYGMPDSSLAVQNSAVHVVQDPNQVQAILIEKAALDQAILPIASS